MSKEKIYKPLVHTEEVLDILNKISIFGALNERQLKEIFRLLETASYEEGEYICRQGEPPSHIYIIESGEVKVVYDAGGASLELADFGTGDCFGETSVIGIQSHSASVIAVSPTKLIVLERKALFDIFETDKELFGLLILNIARETSRRLYKLDQNLANYILKRRDS